MSNSQVLVLKVHEDDITEEEALAVIDSIAKNFDLRITVHGHAWDDPRFWSEPATEQDLSNLVGMARLIDGEQGGAIIGFIIDDGENLEQLLAVLNGEPDDIQVIATCPRCGDAEIDIDVESNRRECAACGWPDPEEPEPNEEDRDK